MATSISSDGEFDNAGGDIGRHDRELMRRAIRTLAVAIHRRFKALGRRDPNDPQSPLIDQMNVNEWIALIQDEWTNRKNSGD